MKVKLNLVKNRKHRKFGGNTLQEVKNKLGPLEWGQFKPIAGKVKPSLDKQGKVVAVELVVGFTVTMPVWSAYSKAPTVCKEEWDRMYKFLTIHEQTHTGIYLETILKFQKVLEAIEPGTKTKAEINTLLADALKKMEQDQQKFEDETDSGRKRGVFLDPPGVCM